MEALEDAAYCLARDAEPATLYQVACIYALTSRQEPEDRWDAFRLLSLALRQGYGKDLVAKDPDLDPIRTYPEYPPLLRLTGNSHAGGTAKQ